MRGQSHRNYCGPATVANLLRALGVNRTATEDTLARSIRALAGVGDPDPSSGTLETQIVKLITKYRFRVEQFCLHQGHASICALRDNLRLGRPVILAVDDDSHWVLAFGILGSRICVADPADPEVTIVYDERELAARWGSASDPERYYGLVVHPKQVRSKK